MDMAAYEKHLTSELVDYEFPKAANTGAIANVPVID